MKSFVCQYNYYYRITQNEVDGVHVITYFFAIHDLLNISGMSTASPSCIVATFCLLGASAVLCVGGHLFGVSLGGEFPTFIGVGRAFQFRLFLKNKKRLQMLLPIVLQQSKEYKLIMNNMASISWLVSLLCSL